MRILRRGRRRAMAGFTMIELLISLVLVAVVVGLMMQVAVVMLSGFKEQREALELSRNARAGIELLTESVRNASAGVTSGNVLDAVGCNPVVGISVTNYDNQPDEIEMIYASGGIVTSARNDVTSSTTTLTVVNASGILPGDFVIVANGTEGRLLPITNVGSAGVTTDLTTQTNRCTATAPMPSSGFAAGALVVRARYARLAVEVDTDGVPMLTVDPDGDGVLPSEILAEGVEDMQIAIGVDLDGDSAILDLGDNTDEWFYNAPGDGNPPAITGGQWRALRVTITARDRLGRGSSARPAAEDRAAGSTDTHRRRTLRTQIEIRNLGRAF
ncbi:MAG TPA: prepilin-type N-terminal cleavage/methylation domain-containing protein [Kofleriaceae bacterium]|nr:prepilin-type N-terminal cleavage/methylation domain-containing protein [Kofleriaceae bacterium]